MLRKRLVAAVLLIVPMASLIWLDVNWNHGRPGLWLLPAAWCLSLLIANELTSMLRNDSPGALDWVVYVGVTACHVGVTAPLFLNESWEPTMRWPLVNWALTATFFLALLQTMRTYAEPQPAVIRVSLTMFATLYAGWLMTFLCATRIELDNARGAFAIFSVLFIIKMSDAGAFFVGKRFGKRKLAPILSPGKTVEGFLGGWAAAVVAAVVLMCGLAPQVLSETTFSPLIVFAYASTLMISGALGDLAESLIKRDMGCKDSSGWLPGLGGIMDTADSVLLSAPVAYLWWSSGVL